MLAKSDTPEPPLSAAGSLHVSARLVGGVLDDLQVRLVRPPVARIFIGRPPQFVRDAVPRLYALCRTAQEVAAHAALAAATGAPATTADECALWLEFLHETFWRLLLDWPPALGVPPAPEAFVAWRAAGREGDAVAATQRLFADTLDELGERCLARLVDRETPDFAFPAPLPEPWLAFWRGAAERPPPWRVPASIAAAYRQRLAAARLACAALAGGQPFPLAAAGDSGRGVAQVLTARGVLTHAVSIDHGLVTRYRVQAPTDESFATAALLAGLLAGQRFALPAAARRALEQAILALDPCLPHAVELHDA
jgi:hypothetical protein